MWIGDADLGETMIKKERDSPQRTKNDEKQFLNVYLLN